jgi:hypothetical protein
MRHLGQMNSVMPGATARTPRQPAQRTWTAAAGAGEAPRPAIAGGGGGEGFRRRRGEGRGVSAAVLGERVGFYRGSGILATHYFISCILRQQ